MLGHNGHEMNNHKRRAAKRWPDGGKYRQALRAMTSYWVPPAQPRCWCGQAISASRQRCFAHIDVSGPRLAAHPVQ